MDTLIRERNDKEEIWYSEDYLRKQIERSYRAGIHKGIRVQFHAVTPVNIDSVDNLINEFKRLVEEEYQKSFNNGEVWTIS